MCNVHFALKMWKWPCWHVKGCVHILLCERMISSGQHKQNPSKLPMWSKEAFEVRRLWTEWVKCNQGLCLKYIILSQQRCVLILKTSIKFSFSHFTQHYLSEQNNTIPHTLQLFETFKQMIIMKWGQYEHWTINPIFKITSNPNHMSDEMLSSSQLIHVPTVTQNERSSQLAPSPDHISNSPVQEGCSRALPRKQVLLHCCGAIGRCDRLPHREGVDAHCVESLIDGDQYPQCAFSCEPRVFSSTSLPPTTIRTNSPCRDRFRK